MLQCIVKYYTNQGFPVKGKYHLERYELSGLCSLFGCPGPGSSWGDLATLPASKEAVSPSPLNVMLCYVGVGGGVEQETKA